MPKKSANETLHLEAHPKAVKRALRAVDTGFSVVEVRDSNNAEGEHGKTTLIFTHSGDATQLRVALDALTKQTNIEQHDLLADDEEDA
jgi:acetolactate synthase regulatory subunit